MFAVAPRNALWTFELRAASPMAARPTYSSRTTLVERPRLGIVTESRRPRAPPPESEPPVPTRQPEAARADAEHPSDHARSEERVVIAPDSPPSPARRRGAVNL